MKTQKRNRKYLGIKINIAALFVIAAILIFTFAIANVSKANADNSSYSKFYFALNGGIGNTHIGNGFPNKSSGTYNLTFGDNYHLNNFVIGGGVLLGYADNGSYSYNDGSVNAYYNFSVHSVYYGAFLKGGYDFNNITPFVKLGYINYGFVSSNNNNGYYNYSYYNVSNEGGLLYGIGVKYSFNPNWGITAQYMGTSLSNSYRVNNYLIGIDYSF
ncbi:MAG: outer membrane protein [bacterium]